MLQEALLINSCRKEMEELINKAHHVEVEAGVHAGTISTYHDQVNMTLCLPIVRYVISCFAS
jgi:hypothetical protein